MQRLIVTRPRDQAGPWLTALRAAGFDALALPLIGIEAVVAQDAQDALVAAWHQLRSYDAVLFVSANAVVHFFAARPRAVVLPEVLAPVRLLATGPGSVAALLRVGVDRRSIDAPAEDAAQFDSEALWQLVAPRLPLHARVLIVRGDQAQVPPHDRASWPAPAASSGVGRDWFAEQVQARGGVCTHVVAYQRCVAHLGANALALLQVAATDGSIWLFSSSEALRNLSSVAPGQSWQQARALATHPRIAALAREIGFGRVHVARPAIPDLIASIESVP